MNASRRPGVLRRVSALCAAFSFALISPLFVHARQASQAAQPIAYAAAFTPEHTQPLVLDTIRGARESLLVAADAFTSKPVATEAATGHSAARFLANERVPVRTKARSASQHNKFVVGGLAMQTGSDNDTAAASQGNAGNVLVVRNAPKLAVQSTRERWRL